MWPDELLAKNPKAKQFVAIRPNRFPVWQTVIQGAGAPVTIGYANNNTMTGHNSVVSLVCYVQINADPDMNSVQELTEQTLGILSFVQKVVAAVQFWNPFRVGTADTYLREPARMTDAGFGMDTKKIGDGWWVKSPIDLEMKFTAHYPATPT
mgnify:CR=1 FL=1